MASRENAKCRHPDLRPSVDLAKILCRVQAFGHVRTGFAYYLDSVAFLEAHKAGIYFIGGQETFEQDVAILKKKLSIDYDLSPPADDVGAHRTPSDMDRTMSDLGAANLKDWFEKDYRLYEWCLAYREELIASSDL